jgi:Undecaprenyl-phosphate glucose phosphotransferase
MLYKNARFQSSLGWAADLVVLAAAFALALVIRFNTPFWPHSGIPPLADTLVQAFFALVIFSAIMRMNGLYRSSRRATRWSAEYLAIFKSVFVGTVTLLAFTYVVRDVRYTRGGLLVFAALAFGGLCLERTAIRALMARFRHKNGQTRRVLVVGAGDLAQRLLGNLMARPDLGLEIVGLLTRHPHKVGSEVLGVPVIDEYPALPDLLAQQRIDQVFFALPLDASGELPGLLNGLVGTEPVDVHVVPDLAQWIVLGGGVYDLDGLPLVSLQDSPVGGWDAVAKRAFDLFFGLPILLFAAPVIAIFALFVKLSSRGPIFYGQERMGLDGRRFFMWKLRSMRTDAEAKSGAVWASADDNRTTWVGGFMRQFSIDELPQLWNVVVGDMSLVGPRPERPVFIEQFKHEIPGYNLRHKVKAGLTGLAQVEGWRGDTSLEKRIERDLWYIEHWSVWLDLKILLRTAFGGFLSKNAY